MAKLDNQADAIKRAVEAIAKFSGKPRGRGRVRALQRPRRPMISCGRFRYEFAAAIVGRDAPLLGAGPLELTFPDHEEFLPSPAKNRPKPPCANNSGSRRL